jgi:hypothetical protein
MRQKEKTVLCACLRKKMHPTNAPLYFCRPSIVKKSTSHQRPKRERTFFFSLSLGFVVAVGACSCFFVLLLARAHFCFLSVCARTLFDFHFENRVARGYPCARTLTSQIFDRWESKEAMFSPTHAHTVAHASVLPPWAAVAAPMDSALMPAACHVDEPAAHSTTSGSEADFIERLILDMLVTGGAASHVDKTVALLCGPVVGPVAAAAVAEKIGDLLSYNDDPLKAAAVLCQASSQATVACFRSRTLFEWIRRYPDMATHPATLGFDTSPSCPALITLLDMAKALRTSRRTRRCALYALYAVDTASAMAKPVPFGALDLESLEGWARARQRATCCVPPLSLDGVPLRVGTNRVWPIVLDVVPLPLMTHNEIVAAVFVFGSLDALYAGANIRLPSEAEAKHMVNGILSREILYAMLMSESTGDASLAMIKGGIDIFAAYPGTRVVISRHVRDIISNAAADIGILLAL